MYRKIQKEKSRELVITILLMFIVVVLLVYTASPYIKGDSPFSSNVEVSDDPGSSSQNEPSLGVAPSGDLYVAWEDHRNGDWDIFFANSTDGGATWSSTDVMINTNTTNDQRLPSLAVGSNGVIYVVWQDARNGSDLDIFFSRSSDGGATWLDPEIRVNIDTSGLTQSKPDIAVDSNNDIYVVWQDFRSSDYDIYFAMSSDGGVSWTDPAVKVNADTSTTSQFDPTIAVDTTGTIYVAWEDENETTFDYDIYFAKSTDDGATWTDPSVKVYADSTSKEQADPSIAVDSSQTIYIAWEDLRNDNSDIFFAKSTDGGATWTDSNERVNKDVGTKNQNNPDVAVDSNGYIYLAWEDYRDDHNDIYFANSFDGGGTWTDPNMRVNNDPGSTDQEAPSIAVDSGGTAYVAWGDYRTNNYDIYFAYLEPQPMPPTASDLKVEGFSGSTPGIQHIIPNDPELSFTYNDFKSDPLASYNVSVWDSGGSNLLWFCNTTHSAASGSTVTVTYNTAPCPTNGPSLIDGTTYKLRVQVENDTGAWSTFSEVDFHLNEVLPPTTPVLPLDDALIVASATQTVSWTSPGTDSEGDSPTGYSWEVATDSDFTNVFESGSGFGTESVAFNTTPSGDFYWRIYLNDGWENSVYGNQPDGFWNFTTYTSTTPNNSPTITNKNSAPTGADIGSKVTFTFTATDPDSDPLSWSKISGPNWLSIGSANGTVYGTPSQGDFGSNAFTIQVSDGRGGTDSHTFTITVDSQVDGDGTDDDEQEDFLPLLLIIVIVIVVVAIILIFALRR
ncbi:MAG: exo-alpha-sialidase [Thermoplasmata archaeon]|nr:MAG: exo-alpha-sialidase [Thermoplasmata archaeon]